MAYGKAHLRHAFGIPGRTNYYGTKKYLGIHQLEPLRYTQKLCQGLLFLT